MDIAVIGSNMVDLITYIDRMPKLGETIEAPSFKIGCGGKGANQAVAAAKLGSDVMMLTKVGDDLFADNTLKKLSSEWYKYWLCNSSKKVFPVVSHRIFVDKSSQNSILIIKGANSHLSTKDIDDAENELKKM